MAPASNAHRTTTQGGKPVMPMHRHTQAPGALLDNPRLTSKAKGVFIQAARLQQHGVPVTVAELTQVARDGHGAIKAGLVELETAGYLLRECTRAADGTITGITYTLTSNPTTTEGVQ